MNWFARYKYYLLPWVVLLAYLLLADSVYAALFVKNGKPEYKQAEAFVETGNVNFAVDTLLELNYEGQEMYDLRGWAFSPKITDLNNMEMKVVLRSVKENLVFSPTVWKREKLNEAMPQFNMDLTNAGYRVLISKHALDIENYQIGILITDKTTGEQFFTLTSAYIERSPNRLRFIK